MRLPSPKSTGHTRLTTRNALKRLGEIKDELKYMAIRSRYDMSRRKFEGVIGVVERVIEDVKQHHRRYDGKKHL